jgi:ribosomal protein S27AE
MIRQSAPTAAESIERRLRCEKCGSFGKAGGPAGLGRDHLPAGVGRSRMDAAAQLSPPGFTVLILVVPKLSMCDRLCGKGVFLREPRSQS